MHGQTRFLLVLSEDWRKRADKGGWKQRSCLHGQRKPWHELVNRPNGFTRRSLWKNMERHLIGEAEEKGSLTRSGWCGACGQPYSWRNQSGCLFCRETVHEQIAILAYCDNVARGCFEAIHFCGQQEKSRHNWKSWLSTRWQTK